MLWLNRHSKPFFRNLLADFCCEERKLIIEFDGGQHDGSSYDERRDKWLGDHGYRVLRIWNNDVLENTEGVLEAHINETH